MMNDEIDKIVAETIQIYNFKDRLESPVLMQQGTEELLERIKNAMMFAAHKTLSTYLEEQIAKLIAAREVKA